MADYISKTVQMATTINKGVIDDHIDLSPEFGSDCRARQNNNPSLRRYSGFIRRDFNVENGPVPNLGPDACWSHPRNYRNTHIEFSDLPLDEAVQRAEQIAKSQGIVLFLQREFPEQAPYTLREIIYHPAGWEPHEG